MARQRFQAGIGGTLRFIPPEAVLAGPPTVATVSILASTGQDLPTQVQTAAAVVDPVSTTFSAPASAGDRTITLASVTGIAVGRQYLVVPGDGERFLVEVDAVATSAKVVLLAEPLPRDLGSDAQLLGVEVTYALSGAQCPMPVATGVIATVLDEQPSPALGYGHSYRAAWLYSIGGVQYGGDQLYEVRRRLLKPTLTADQVQRRLPAEWDDLVPGGPREIQRVMDDAWDDLLEELAAKGFDPDRVMDADRFRRPHRSLVVAALASTWPPAAWATWSKERHDEAVQDLQDALASGSWYDKVEDAVQAPAEVKWPEIRLTR
jgi:hypothetical protein